MSKAKAKKRAPCDKALNVQETTPGKARQTPAQKKLRAHRQCQNSIAKILNKLFGKLAKCKPELWDQRAFLLIVGLVYERLTSKEQNISLKELTALGRILAEQRRSRLPRRSRRSCRRKAATGQQGLPENFGEVIERVYGAAAKAR